MKRKLMIVLLAAICLAMVLTACGGDKNTHVVQINYNFDGASVSAVSVSEGGRLSDIALATREGYSFEGWFLDAECTNPVLDTVVSGNVSIYAKWSENKTKYKISFDLGSKDLGEIEAIFAQTGGGITLPNCDVKNPGYRFSGWKDSAQKTYNAGDAYLVGSSDTTLSAIWQKTYVVSFNLGGASGTLPQSGEYVRNENLKLPSASGLSKPSKTFYGWFDGFDYYNADAKYVVKQNTVLSATWAGEYSVSFALNGGTGTVPASKKYETDSAIVLPAAPSKTGFSFAGWNDGMNTYAAESRYVVKTSDVVFEAVWEQSFTAQFIYNHYQKENTVFLEIKYDYNSLMQAPQVPTRTDHTFLGWYKDAACQLAWNFKTDKITKDTKLFAKWEHNIFYFKLTSDKLAYEIAGRNRANDYLITGDTFILPREYEGKPVIGLADTSAQHNGVFYDFRAEPTTFIVPKEYKYIGDFGFASARNLKYVRFETGSLLEKIGMEAFIYDRKLINIENIPASLKEVGTDTFEYCTMLQGPFDLSHTALTKIPAGMFFRCKSLKGVILPDAVTEIGAAAFTSCESITEFTFPKGLKKIDRFLFGASTIPSEEALNIGDIQHFEYNKFDENGDIIFENGMALYEYCNMQLTTIFIPKEIEVIDYGAFAFCVNLSEIVFEEGSKIKDIGWCAFMGSGLKTIEIPAGVDTINFKTFYGCEDLESVTFADGNELEGIISLAFTNCYKLKTFTVPDTCIVILDGVFRNCTALESVYISESCVELGTNVFRGCIALNNVVIPSSMYIIQYSAFADCTSLTNITFKEGVSIMGDSVFQNCTALENIMLPASLMRVGMYFFDSCTKLKSVAFAPNPQIQKLNYGFFYDCTAIETFEIPSSISSFESVDYITLGANKFTSFTVASDSPFYTAVDGVVYSKNMKTAVAYPFAKIPTNGVVIIPNGVEIIGHYFLYQIQTVTEVRLPASIKTLEYAAFRFMHNLKRVVFADGVDLKYIGNVAFANSTKMVNDNYGEGVIEKAEFSEIIIPSLNVPTLGTSIFVYATENPNFKIKVPKEVVEKYKAAEGWSTYAQYITAIDEE